MLSFCINYSLANQNCAATFEMWILHSMTSAHFKFHCIRTVSKRGDGTKGSNSLLRFRAWDVLIEDKIGEVSSEGFWKELQLENAVHTAFMWESLFCVIRFPSMNSNIIWSRISLPAVTLWHHTCTIRIYDYQWSGNRPRKYLLREKLGTQMI